MKLKLYHYVMCPYCIRVRMTLGYLGLAYESIVVPYDDEETPLKLTGKKMLPIMEIDGKVMNESLDIMAILDKENKLKVKEITSSPGFKDFDALLNRLVAHVHNMAMPYFIYTPEFNEKSRQYFQSKKEEKRGPFKDLVKNQRQYVDQIQKEFSLLEKELSPFYHSSTFSLYDLLLAAHVWGLYVVPEFQFSERIHKYLQSVKEACHFNYHQDYWR